MRGTAGGNGDREFVDSGAGAAAHGTRFDPSGLAARGILLILAAALISQTGAREAHALPVQSAPAHALMETRPLEPTDSESFSPFFEGGILSWGTVASLLELWPQVWEAENAKFAFGVGGAAGGLGALSNADILALTETRAVKPFRLFSRVRFFRAAALVAGLSTLKNKKGGGFFGGDKGGKVQPVPEPSSLLLFASGLAAVGALTWRQRRREAALQDELTSQG